MSPARREIATIADAVAVDALLVNKMKRTLAAMLQLNVRGFRTTYKGSYYTPFEVLKQSLELLFEFGVSTKSYREALRTIGVYSEGDKDAEQALREGFSTFANAAYSVYAGMRYVDEISPELVFLEGIQPDDGEFQRVFRSVGVKPPALVPRSSRKAVFLDEGFEPYKLALDQRTSLEREESERMRYWSQRIVTAMAENDQKALLRIGASHLGHEKSLLATLGLVGRKNMLPELLDRAGYDLRIVFKGILLENVFGRG